MKCSRDGGISGRRSGCEVEGGQVWMRGLGGVEGRAADAAEVDAMAASEARESLTTSQRRYGRHEGRASAVTAGRGCATASVQRRR